LILDSADSQTNVVNILASNSSCGFVDQMVPPCAIILPELELESYRGEGRGTHVTHNFVASGTELFVEIRYIEGKSLAVYFQALTLEELPADEAPIEPCGGDSPRSADAIASSLVAAE
jgi:hypothetical protein